MTRRHFLKLSAAGSAALFSGSELFYAARFEPFHPKIFRIHISLRNLPLSFEGVKLVQLSDIHHGPYIPLSYVEDCVKKVNALNPDIIVLTGDFVSRSKTYIAPCVEILKTLNAKRGVFAVPGNHDYWVDISRTKEAFNRAGIPLFFNRHTVLWKNGEKAALGGLDDLWVGKPDFHETFKGVDAHTVKILMMHNPDLFENLPFPLDFIMAGHTHGGQVSLPFFGPPIVPSIYGKKYAAGLFHNSMGMMYVNRGLGMITPPVRFRVPPEITLFTLTRRA